MDMFTGWIVSLSQWSRSHLGDISMALMASTLVLFGPILNAWLRRQTGTLHFIFRTLIFILVCAIGYGLAMIHLTPLIKQALAQLNNYTLAPVLLVLFVLIGIFADRH
ncbi:DUF3392 domain-containing protein [Thiopseudomonas denitrificans]|uniref:Uncharacterized protein DUF3392 n=1 Tax=Thiopseudomonas denitrificans TaxID=1501432 RepID=A0A4R6TV29_9GAMM|nr:DUF3392 domain-containing protein [Thiopseudomonas denitrificans]TDQ37036.1 uncharacterized protein DUF3392 [Thiopseudomonas denitrificans]